MKIICIVLCTPHFADDCIVGRRFAAALLPRLFGTNPRSHHKGATGRVRTGDQLERLPVLCHGQLGQDIVYRTQTVRLRPGGTGPAGQAQAPPGRPGSDSQLGLGQDTGTQRLFFKHCVSLRVESSSTMLRWHRSSK